MLEMHSASCLPAISLIWKSHTHHFLFMQTLSEGASINARRLSNARVLLTTSSTFPFIYNSASRGCNYPEAILCKNEFIRCSEIVNPYKLIIGDHSYSGLQLKLVRL